MCNNTKKKIDPKDLMVTINATEVKGFEQTEGDKFGPFELSFYLSTEKFIKICEKNLKAGETYHDMRVPLSWVREGKPETFMCDVLEVNEGRRADELKIRLKSDGIKEKNND